MPLQGRHDPDRLRVVIEPAIGRHQRRERVLPGMAERRMAEIVRHITETYQVWMEARPATPASAAGGPRW